MEFEKDYLDHIRHSFIEREKKPSRVGFKSLGQQRTIS